MVSKIFPGIFLLQIAWHCTSDIVHRVSNLYNRADEILNEAYDEAAKENKNVFVMFHTSWRVCCHKMNESK